MSEDTDTMTAATMIAVQQLATEIASMKRDKSGAMRAMRKAALKNAHEWLARTREAHRDLPAADFDRFETRLLGFLSRIFPDERAD